MKIEPNELSTLLKRASMWAGSPELEKVELDFQEKGVTLAQKNPMDTVGVTLIAKKDLFNDYDDIGRIQLPTERIADVTSKGFKTSKYVNVDFDDDAITIEGEKDHYEKQLTEEDLPTKDFSVRSGEFGIFPKGLDIVRYYTLPSGLLSNIVSVETEKEIYKLDFGDDLVVNTQVEDEKGNILEGFNRELDYSNTWKDGEGSTKVAADYLNDALSQMTGEFTLGFVGDGAPLVLTSRDEKSAWCYLIAPWGEGSG